MVPHTQQAMKTEVDGVRHSPFSSPRTGHEDRRLIRRMAAIMGSTEVRGWWAALTAELVCSVELDHLRGYQMLAVVCSLGNQEGPEQSIHVPYMNVRMCDPSGC